MIGELYTATEANGGMINIHNKVGAVGRASPLLVLLNYKDISCLIYSILLIKAHRLF